jgi:hypothetical protein
MRLGISRLQSIRPACPDRQGGSAGHHADRAVYSSRQIALHSHTTSSGAGQAAPKGGRSRNTGSCGSWWRLAGRVALAARTPALFYSLEALPL